MLSTVLSSDRTIEVNIEIMRAFVILRRTAYQHNEIWHKINELAKKYDSQLKKVFEALKLPLEPPLKSRKQIGFKQGSGKKRSNK